MGIIRHRCRKHIGIYRCILDSRHTMEVGCLFHDDTTYQTIMENPELVAEKFRKWLWK